MANYKTFTVTTEIWIDRQVWRRMGYGDQPSKHEVYEVFDRYVRNWYLPGASTVVEYLGRPGVYRVTSVVRGTLPWWVRLGFGISAARREIKDEFLDKFRNIAKVLTVSVEIGA